MRALGIRDAFSLYKKEVKDHKNLNTFLLVAGEFNKFIVNKLYDGEIIGMPERTGRLAIIGKKVKPTLDEEGRIKGLTPDWKRTNELWNRNPEAKEKKEIIYYFNEHTNGIRYSVNWSKKDMFMRFKDFYSFRMTRKNKRFINKLIVDGHQYLVKYE